jgi:hypothetical protein
LLAGLDAALGIEIEKKVVPALGAEPLAYVAAALSLLEWLIKMRAMEDQQLRASRCIPRAD